MRHLTILLVLSAALLIAGGAALPQPTAGQSARAPVQPPPVVVQPEHKLVLPSWYPSSHLEGKAEVGNYYYSRNWIGDIGGDR